MYTHTHNTGTVSQASRRSLVDVYMHSSNTQCSPQYMCRWHEQIEALTLPVGYVCMSVGELVRCGMLVCMDVFLDICYSTVRKNEYF